MTSDGVNLLRERKIENQRFKLLLAEAELDKKQILSVISEASH